MCTSPLNSSWPIAAFAVLGAFISCGFGGGVVAELLGVWPLPTMGFCAAFAVVALAYLSAPKFNNLIAILIFLVGSLLAWLILKSIYHPEVSEQSVPQQNYLPFISTVAGGLAALLICLTPWPRSSGT